MKFSQVLEDVMEADDGLLLRVTAYERMMEEREKTSGWSGRLFEILRRRSWKITRWMRADHGALDGRK